MVKMNEQDARLQEHFEMVSPIQWKAFSHPLRLRILKLLIDEAHTNEELAAALGEKSGKLYFHTKKLLDAGLIVLESTRQTGPNTEKFYRAVARRFIAPAATGGGAAPRLAAMLGSALDLYRHTWQESGGLSQQTEFGFHLILPLDPPRRAQFVARLQALRDDFKTSGSAETDAQPVVLTVIMHSLDRREDQQNALMVDRIGSADSSALERDISK